MSLARLHTGFMLLLILSPLGCVCHSGPSCKHGSSWCNNPGNPCHGYYSTCWREWPCECERCPPFTLGLLEGAVLLDQDGQEPLPPARVQPLPMPQLPPPQDAEPGETSQNQRPNVPHRPAGRLEKTTAQGNGPSWAPTVPEPASAMPQASEHQLISAQEPLYTASELPFDRFPSHTLHTNDLREPSLSQRKSTKSTFSSANYQGTLLGN